MRLHPTLVLGLLAAAAPPAGAAGDDAPAPAPDAPAPAPPEGKGMEVTGGIEAGLRAVTGKEGRYEEDVNLDGGFRILSAEVRGDSLGGASPVDWVRLSAVGLGDPDRSVLLEAGTRDAFDFRLHSDRRESVLREAEDLHPTDTVRTADGASLSVKLRKGLEVRLSSERVSREGDAVLAEQFVFESFPAPATIEYLGWFHSAGFDGSSGAWRFGGTFSWSRAEDDSIRTLDRPDTPLPDSGAYRNRSDFRSRTAVGRAGVRLLDGAADLGVLGGYTASGTDSSVQGRQILSTSGPDGIEGTMDDLAWSSETRAETEASFRTPWGRADLLLHPHADWEVLARYEDRRTDERGGGDVWVRDLTPPFTPPTDPFLLMPAETTAETRLRRASLEGRWRASREWRFRGGAERVAEDAELSWNGDDDYSPVTTVGTAGFDWVPSDRFDASVLGRIASARDPATALSMEDGESLSVRLRAKRPDGWHAEGYLRIRQRRNGDADAVSTVDVYGYAMGFAGTNRDEWMEFSVSRHDYTLTSDTAFVVDFAANPIPSPQRVRYDEAVTAATLEFSQPLKGPVRLFGRGRWSDGNGDTPYDQYDAALGLGWRFRRDVELRGEVRTVVYDEPGSDPDDFSAGILTVSVHWSF